MNFIRKFLAVILGGFATLLLLSALFSPLDIGKKAVVLLVLGLPSALIARWLWPKKQPKRSESFKSPFERKTPIDPEPFHLEPPTPPNKRKSFFSAPRPKTPPPAPTQNFKTQWILERGGIRTSESFGSMSIKGKIYELTKEDWQELADEMRGYIKTYGAIGRRLNKVREGAARQKHVDEGQDALDTFKSYEGGFEEIYYDVSFDSDGDITRAEKLYEKVQETLDELEDAVSFLIDDIDFQNEDP